MMSRDLINRRTFLRSGLAGTALAAPGPWTIAGWRPPEAGTSALILRGRCRDGAQVCICCVGRAADTESAEFAFLRMLIGYPLERVDRASVRDRTLVTIGRHVAANAVGADVVLYVVDVVDATELAQVQQIIRAARRHGMEAPLVVAIGRFGKLIPAPLLGCDAVIHVSHLSADDTISTAAAVLAAHNVLDGLYHHGFIGYDFADVRLVLHGSAFIAVSRCLHGDVGGFDAADRALRLLRQQGVNLSRVAAVNLGINGNAETSLVEIGTLSEKVVRAVPDRANIIFYSTIQEQLGGLVEVSLVVTSHHIPS